MRTGPNTSCEYSDIEQHFGWTLKYFSSDIKRNEIFQTCFFSLNYYVGLTVRGDWLSSANFPEQTTSILTKYREHWLSLECRSGKSHLHNILWKLCDADLSCQGGKVNIQDVTEREIVGAVRVPSAALLHFSLSLCRICRKIPAKCEV